jgi:hypothetical protein
MLVYLVLAGQYESWHAPVALITAVPLSLLGPTAVLSALKIDYNLSGLILLIALSAKNAILIVEVGLELHHRGQAAAGNRRRGGALAPSSHPDDVVRLHSRLGAADAGDRRRRQRAQIDRHHRVLRHAGLDLPRGAVRAGLLRGGAAVRELADGTEAEGAGYCAPRTVRAVILRQCEEQRDEAIHPSMRHWIASAVAVRAMTDTSLRSQ